MPAILPLPRSPAMIRGPERRLASGAVVVMVLVPLEGEFTGWRDRLPRGQALAWRVGTRLSGGLSTALRAWSGEIALPFAIAPNGRTPAKQLLRRRPRSLHRRWLEAEAEAHRRRPVIGRRRIVVGRRRGIVVIV